MSCTISSFYAQTFKQADPGVLITILIAACRAAESSDTGLELPGFVATTKIAVVMPESFSSNGLHTWMFRPFVRATVEENLAFTLMTFAVEV